MKGKRLKNGKLQNFKKLKLIQIDFVFKMLTFSVYRKTPFLVNGQNQFI